MRYTERVEGLLTMPFYDGRFVEPALPSFTQMHDNTSSFPRTRESIFSRAKMDPRFRGDDD